MPDPQFVECEIAGKIAVVRLNRPATLNALSFGMIDALHDALDRAEDAARVLVLCGNGRSFCAGADLSGGMEHPVEREEDRDRGEPLETHLNPLMLRLRDLSIPWISAVQGAAAGGGAGLALAADLVIAAEDAAFIMAFARIGLVPDSGMFHMLVRALGRVRANELMLLGGRLNADRAMELGLVNQVVPGDRLMAEALSRAGQIAAGPASLNAIRQLSWQALDDGFAPMLQAERQAQRDSGHTADFHEGLAAFRDKRPPSFTGT